MEYSAEYNRLRALVDEYLEGCFAGSGPLEGLAEAMRYSLLAGGKRLRPVLALAFCRACGGDEAAALPVACALELLHTYSLIHDDLPAMDDDDLRRGKPTNHKIFGECTAILAGDALQAEAFGMILRADLPAALRADCATFLADTAGIDGICGGQYLDMLGEGRDLTEDELTEIVSRKTGSLFIAACRAGAALGGADEAGREAAMCYGAGFGMAFQIRDDILDVTGSAAALGKNTGSDMARCKTTHMSLYGREKCEEMVRRLTQYAGGALRGAVPAPEFLVALADAMAGRNS